MVLKLMHYLSKLRKNTTINKFRSYNGIGMYSTLGFHFIYCHVLIELQIRGCTISLNVNCAKTRQCFLWRALVVFFMNVHGNPHQTASRKLNANTRWRA